MRSPLRLALWLALAAGCPAPFVPPADDGCSGGSSAGVTRLDTGSAVMTSVFPFDDSQPAPVVHGGQGATMLPILIRVGGASPPACLAQSTHVLDESGSEVGHDYNAVKTYAQPDGTRQTNAMYLVLDTFGDRLTVSTTVGALEVVHHLGTGGAADLGSD